MSFSASTCLTNSGTISLGNLFNIYSNVGGYITPFQTNITYSQLFNNCPYIMGNVPDGTTSIKIINTETKCCSTIELLSNNLCTTCDLAFDEYETSNIGVIVAGELTGSCDTNITDYRIIWYGPNSSTNIAFTSGFGDEFLPRDFTHPLTGIYSPMQPSGTYIPVIDKVKLNGLNFSQTGGTGFIQSELECFNATTVNIEPFTCDNGTEEGDYTHRVEFVGAGVGVTPLTLQSTFELDLTTDYFAWKFSGASIPDSLKITFYGSAYSNPIILEYWVVGVETLTNVNLTTFPKSATTNYYVSKVTSLTPLSRNIGDYLILEVIPNQNNPQTNWDFYFTCLNTFDCSLCIDSYLNTPYKIKTSTIINLPSGNCGDRTISYKVSGCTDNQIMGSDIGKYMVTTFSNIYISPNNLLANNDTSLLNIGDTYWTGLTQCGVGGSGFNVICNPSSTNTIKFEKTINGSGIGTIIMNFSDLSDLTAYKSSYDTRKLSSGWVNDPTNILYYQYVELSIPDRNGLEICGDGTPILKYYIHYSSIITTGGTSGNYSMTMPMLTITNQLPTITTCQGNCDGPVNGLVNTVNNTSTGTTNNTVKISNTGSRYILPFNYNWQFNYTVSGTKYSGYSEGTMVINNSLNSTVPFSGNSYPYVQIPSLSAQTCDFSSIGETVYVGYDFQAQNINIYDYVVVMTNPPNLTSFQIKANPIVNGVKTTTNYPDIAVTVVNGVTTYTNPLYTF
jgi:hypothetical protein